MKKNNKVLVHCCCGICSAHPISHLKELGYEPIAFFFNPNIYPKTEYLKRLEEQKKVCEKFDCALIVEDTHNDLYKEITHKYHSEPERGARCTKCFELRLLRTIQKAHELGVKSFATSITTSPHKDYELITKIGKHFAKYYNMEYLDIDFKKKDGFLKSNNIAKELNLYRQNYCGCEVSYRLASPVDEHITNEVSNGM